MKRTQVESSNIASLGYDAKNEVLEAEFKTGAVYQYENVPKDVFDGVLHAPSVGKAFNQDVVKGGYPYTRVQ